jgi:uncharacterized protein
VSERFLVWRGLDDWLAEATQVHLDADRFQAWGTQLGSAPHPYRVDYALTTAANWITERFQLLVRDAYGERRLDLRRCADGAWTASGRPLPGLEDALDCDLENSPLTNSMPILRERLREGGPPVDLVMAWISLPDLGVRVSSQRYEPMDARSVRFVSLDSDFTAELELDSDGLLARYPSLGERV